MAEAELTSIKKERDKYTPVAPFSGHLRDIDPDLRSGVWVGRKEKLALLVGPDTQVVETYLDEEAVKRIQIGDHGVFIIDSASASGLPLTVTNIDVDSSRVLNNGMLTASLGGHVLTRDRKGQKIPEYSVFRVTLSVDEPSSLLSTQSWRGKVIIRADWESLGWRYLRNVLAILIREAGF